MVLHGRETEQAAIGALLESARAGQGASLVLLGEAGSGKSSLLVETGRAADGMIVATTSGVESEAPLAFAALQRLLWPLRAHLDTVAAPQARALRVAFGEEAGESGDRFLVFMGALSLLAAAAETDPVLVVVDDAQWLDDASAAALHFISRRIAMEPIALLWAARTDGSRQFDPDDLPVVRLGGLGLDEVSAILAEQTRTDVAPEVAALLLATTGGNPLAIRELPSVLTPGQLAGQETFPPRLPVTERVERVFLDRARLLSSHAQALLLVVAADDSDRLTTILRATTELGADSEALAEVERSGLVTVTEGRVILRHPLVRSAVYSATPSAERRKAHAALANALTGSEDADRRAWHRAASVVEPDASVVAELAAAAERAQQRGGHEAAAAAWDRAAQLSGDAGQRARYLFAAAMSSWISAHPDRARLLVDRAVSQTDDPQLLAVARRLRARVEWNTGSVNLAHRMLSDAATDAVAHDPVLARELATEAVSIAVWCTGPRPESEATSLVPAPAPDAPPRERTYHQMLHGLDRVAAGDYHAAVGPLRGAFAAHAGLPEDYDLLPGLSVGAMHVGEFDRAEEYLHGLLSRARNDSGAVMVLYALTRLAMIDVVAARWTDAIGEATEAISLGEVTGHDVLAATPAALLLLLAALRGDQDRFEALAPQLDEATSHSSAGVLGVVLRDVVHWAHGVRLANEPTAALHRFLQMSHDIPRRMSGLDRIEAAVRNDRPELAELWIEDLAGFADATGHAWAEAITEHGRALLAPSETAAGHFECALRLHDRATGDGRPGRPFNRARTALAYGEFLRRARRRVDAREQLREALAVFEGLQARPWIERAATELRASGETVRRRDHSVVEAALTPQERQVAQLVRKGLSNKDVAAQLFVSPRTVDFHLRNVFTKTGVSSRVELAAFAVD